MIMIKRTLGDLTDSAANLLTCILIERSLPPQPHELPLFDEEIADGANRLLVKTAQRQEAG